MGKDSGIQWTTHTWNPWQGCKKKDGDCARCYMFRDMTRLGKDPNKIIRSSDATFRKPISWEEPAFVFSPSWSDFFIEGADEWRQEAFKIIKATPHLTYQLLTKHPERIMGHLPDDWGEGYPNVWLGTSIGHPDALYRFHEIAKVPARCRFISFEPLWLRLEDKNFDISEMIRIHWTIIGGESGNKGGKFEARPCKLSWIEEVVDTWSSIGSAVFVKQLGSVLAREMKLSDPHGGDMNEWPEHLRIREFPKV